MVHAAADDEPERDASSTQEAPRSSCIADRSPVVSAAGASLAALDIVKPKLDEMTREAKEGAARARELRGRLEEATALVDGLVDEARSTLRRAVEFLEREGLRGKKSGRSERLDADGDPRRAEPKSGSSDEARETRARLHD